MCCHKKCITKCQNSTICGPVDAMAASAAVLPSVEFKVTEAECDGDEIDDFEVDDEVEFTECPRVEVSQALSFYFLILPSAVSSTIGAASPKFQRPNIAGH